MEDRELKRRTCFVMMPFTDRCESLEDEVAGRFVIAAGPVSWRGGRRRGGGFQQLISTSSDS